MLQNSGGTRPLPTSPEVPDRNDIFSLQLDKSIVMNAVTCISSLFVSSG